MRMIEKSGNLILVINTLELIGGMAGLGMGYPLVTACCLFLLSLNVLLLYPLWLNSKKKQSAADAKDSIPVNLPAAEPVLPVLPSALLPVCTEDRQQIELLSFLNDFLQEYDAALSMKTAHTIIHAAADEVIIKASPLLLRLAFLNIMDNTLKYLPKTGTITITLSRLDTQALLIWKDNGNGMAESEISRLFTLNFQGTNRLQGTGLGLSQVQAAITAMGGTVYVKSSIGKGFAVYLQLPLAECLLKGEPHES